MSADNRRAAKSRGEMQSAMLDLILKKGGYSGITVNDICETANVGKSDFYSHFAGKQDLKRHGLDHLREALNDLRKAREATGTYTFSLTILEHTRENLETYRALLGPSTERATLDNLRAITGDMIRAEFAFEGRRPPHDLVVQFITGAYLSVLNWWLDNNARMPIAEVDALFRDLMINGAMQRLQSGNAGKT